MEFKWLGVESAAAEAASYLFGDKTKRVPITSPAGVVLDIETTGLKTGSVVTEAALYSLKSNAGERWSIAPFKLGKNLSQEQLMDQAEPWFKERHQAMFSWVGNDSKQITPGQLANRLESGIRGQTVFIQNAPFESRQLGAMLRENVDAPTITKLRSGMETAPASAKSYSNLFYVTGQEMQLTRAVARETGDWMPVFEQMVRETVEPGSGATRVRDIQDVTRAVFSQSERMGLMKPLNSFTGSSINVLSLAMGMGAEEHRALADTEKEAKVLKRMWHLATGMQHARSGGFMGTAGFLFNQSYRDDLTAIKRIDLVREKLKIDHIHRSFAEARLAIEFDKTEYSVTDKFKTWMAPMDTYDGRRVQQAISVPQKRIPRDLDEAIGMLSSQRIAGDGMSSVVDDAVLRIKVASESQLRSMVHAPFSLEHQAGQELTSMMDKAGRFTNWDATRILFAKHPIASFGFAAAGLGLGLGAIEAVTRRTSKSSIEGDAHVNWDGLEAYGIGADMRRESGDFGSGWRGLAKGILNRMHERVESLSRGIVSSGHAELAGLNAGSKTTRLMKKLETTDYAQANNQLRKSRHGPSRSVATTSRLRGISAPDLRQRSMAELMAGRDSGPSYTDRSGYIGYRDFNVIKGLGHGKRYGKSDFGSPHKGLAKAAAGVYDVTSELWNAFGMDASTKGISISRGRVEWMLNRGDNRTLESVLDTPEMRDFGRVGLLRPGLVGIGKERTIRHETFHTFLPDEVRAGLASASDRIVDITGLRGVYEKASPLNYRAENLLEEIAARRAELDVVPNSSFRQTFSKLYKPTLDIHDSFAPLLEAAVDASSHNRDLYRMGLKPKGNVIPGWHGAYNKIMGMDDSGIASLLRKKHDFGSPWQGLRKLLPKVKQFFSGMSGRPSLTDDVVSSMIRNIQEAGIAGDDAAARALVKGGQWLKMEGKSWLQVSELGEGGFGKASLLLSESGSQVGVLKVPRAEAIGQGAAARQAYPLVYEGGLKPDAKYLAKSPDHKAAYKAAERARKDVVKAKYKQGTDQGESEAQMYFTHLHRQTYQTPATTAKQTVLDEVALQRAAYEETLAGGSYHVPEIYGEGKIEPVMGVFAKMKKALGFKSPVSGEFGFVQEYGGMPLSSAMREKLIPDEMLVNVKRQVREYVDESTTAGSIFNWDLSGNNIVVDVKTGIVKIIDYGAATRLPGNVAVTHKRYAKQFGDEVMARIFNADSITDKNVAKELVKVASKDATDQMAIKAVRTERQAIEVLQDKRISSTIRNAERTNRMAELQKNTASDLFRTATNHTKGGG